MLMFLAVDSAAAGMYGHTAEPRGGTMSGRKSDARMYVCSRAYDLGGPAVESREIAHAHAPTGSWSML